MFKATIMIIAELDPLPSDVAKRCHLIVEWMTQELLRLHVLLDSWQRLQNSEQMLQADIEYLQDK